MAPGALKSDLVAQVTSEAALHREMDKRKRDLLPVLLVGVLLVAGALFYVWQHVQVVRLSYKVERLDSERASLAKRERELTLEVARLKSLRRVEEIARGQLGMVTPAPGQLYLIPVLETPSRPGSPE